MGHIAGKPRAIQRLPNGVGDLLPTDPQGNRPTKKPPEGGLSGADGEDPDARPRSTFRKIKIALHAFDDARQSVAGYLSIRLTELYSPKPPIHVTT